MIGSPATWPMARTALSACALPRSMNCSRPRRPACAKMSPRRWRQGRRHATNWPRTASGDVGRMLARRGLAAALLDLAAAAGAEADVRIDGKVDAGAATVAWFVASEALTNALKHAGPARIWLTAVTGPGGLRVEVADDGVGGADKDGHGLTGLRERLAGQGGELRVLAGAAAGTRVVAEIPLDGGVPRRCSPGCAFCGGPAAAGRQLVGQRGTPGIAWACGCG